MNETNTQQVITFRDIWELFLQRLVIILLVTAVSVAIFYVYNKVSYIPLYQSTATLYIAGDDVFEGNSSADAYNTYSLALKVVNDCDYLLSSRSVVDQLIQEMNLDTSYGVLQSRVSTDNPTNTRILEVTVEMESPALSEQVVNRLCEIGVAKINEVMGADDYVQLFEYGTHSAYPCNETPKATYLIVGSVAAVLTFGLCLLLFLLDDRLRTADHIEQVLGRSVLGDIPDVNFHGQKGRYGYYRYKGYGPYGRSYGKPYGKPYGTSGNKQTSQKKGRG